MARRKHKRKLKHRGIALVELLVATTLIGVLAGVVMVSLGNGRRVARDRLRLSTVKLIQGAMESYLADGHSIYPYSFYHKGDTDCVIETWDCSYDGTFVDFLVQDGYLTQAPTDPLHPSQQYTYVYNGYVSGGSPVGGGKSAIDGCVTPYYILLALLETDSLSEARGDRTCWTGTGGVTNTDRVYVVIDR